MIQFEIMVQNLVKPGSEIVNELTPHQASLIHMALGISGEAGELLDAIKKSSIYQKPIDMQNIIEELGDLEFYMEGLRQELKITREQTIQGNISKLSKRYESMKYSNQAAIERNDKK